MTALGDETRRAIFELLADRPRAVGEIATYVPVSRPAVSQHLKVLKDAGLVVDESRGTQRLYQLHGQGVEAAQEYLVQVWGEAAARFRIFAENTKPAPRKQ